jgi:protein SCO1/2
MSQRTIRNVLWVFCGLMLLGVAARHLLAPTIRSGGSERPLEGLQTFGTVPDFTLTEASGRSLGLADLSGKLWVADFIYTTCRDTCPLQSAEMARLQRELNGKGEFRLVSITVDPDHDTPEVLARYGERFHADRRYWFFLTGDQTKIYQLARDGFRLSATPLKPNGGETNREFIHSSRFVIVDGKTQIRGYYDSRDPQALHRLREDLKSLIQEHGRTYG